MSSLNANVLSGSMAGSILGGRWSDHVFKKLKAQNGGVSEPEVTVFSFGCYRCLTIGSLTCV